jgi:hypothetical protein
MRSLLLATLLCVLPPFAARLAAQQIVDPDFKAAVAHPAYSGTGPTVAIDEAHANFHTATGQYKPFADLLTADGYRVTASTRKFERAVLAGIDVLVIANARNLAALEQGDPSQPAFTEHECDVVRDWVRKGGSLLLISDHAPFGGAAENLSRRFGVLMSKGWTFDYAKGGGINTTLHYARENGLLGEHVILHGRNAAEEVRFVTAFTGQSLSVPPGATVLLKISDTARDAAAPADLEAEQEASTGAEASARGQHSTSARGRAQGLAMQFGRGKVVVLGEAGMFSAQIVRLPNGSDVKFGMNVTDNDDGQFALNVLHWLTGLLE